MSHNGKRHGIFSSFLFALTVLPGSGYAGEIQSGSQIAAFPPPPGPYQAAPATFQRQGSSAVDATQSTQQINQFEQMRKRHEELMKQREESMRANRQEMIKRYQAMREQGFHAEREDTVDADNSANKAAEPAWVEERRKKMQVLRERHMAEQQARIKALEEAQKEAQEQAAKRTAMQMRPSAAMPGWRPRPQYAPQFSRPMYPPHPSPAQMGWAPRPPMMMYYPTSPQTAINPGTVTEGNEKQMETNNGSVN